MIACAYPLLSLWVGHRYVERSALFLEVLVAGNMIRQLGYPYAVFVAATGKQHLATGAAIAEAIVNFALSIWLVQRMGAIGVAIGTLVGAFVSVAVHLTVSMHYNPIDDSYSTLPLFVQRVTAPAPEHRTFAVAFPFLEKFHHAPGHPRVVWRVVCRYRSHPVEGWD